MDTLQDKKVYLNGEYLPLSEAKVSVLDRGFLFGDGVYEVIPAYFGKLFCLEAHFQRLHNSLNAIRLSVPFDISQWLGILQPLLIEGDAQYIYLQITRGVADKRDHAFPEQSEPTIFAMCSAIVPFSHDQGVKAITLDDMRWALCNIKATTLLANLLLRQQAVDKGCAEAILIKEGYATEGAASNIFVVINGVIMTPPNSNEILPGITRDVIIDLAQANDLSFREEAISLEALQEASEIWLTSSTREILPVTTLDNKAVGNGRIGPVWQIMQNLFQEYKRAAS
ncbi:MAG: D-amino acid aminotransferase [Methyloprofundus sp.]|nr:D-amino acid aminotransferase [Methyloprofundus sp.]